MDNPLKYWLQTDFIAQNTIVLGDIDSTNDFARQLIATNPPTGTVIISRTQTKGRGQKHNIWASPDGGLYYSCILHSNNHENLTMMTLACGIACRETISELSNLNSTLKWINDLEFKNKKLGGILLESRIRSNNVALVTGIGINVNTPLDALPQELKESTTSLLIETGTTYDIYRVAAVLSNHLEKYFKMFEEKNFKMIKSLWLKYTSTLGKTAIFNTPGGQKRGLVIDINEQGALIIQSLDGNQYTLADNTGVSYI